MSYDSSDIRILSREEQLARNPFVLKHDLEQRYPSIAPIFISRLVDACLMADYPIELAEQRYLAKDLSIQPTPELLAVYRQGITDRQAGR